MGQTVGQEGVEGRLQGSLSGALEPSARSFVLVNSQDLVDGWIGGVIVASVVAVIVSEENKIKILAIVI